MAITHALMAAGDVALVVSLANSFLSVDADAARGKVLLYLVVSVAPFAVVAPLIGPFLDRARGGRRVIIQFTAIGRGLSYLALAASLDSWLMFPLAFVCMVLQKTYSVSKSAIVPTIVRDEDELVEANSKLGLFAGIIGGAAAVPLGLASLASPKVSLIGGAALFALATIHAGRLPRDVVAQRPTGRSEQVELRNPRLMMAASALGLIRASIGFLFFHLFFWIRTEKYPSYWLALAVGSVTIGVMLGNLMAPVLRRMLSEEWMLTGSLGLVGVSGVLAGIVSGVGAAVLLSITVNVASAVGRMAFESTVQRSAPDANVGRAFAQFETRFQLSWVLGAVVSTLLLFPGWLGFLIVGIIGISATASFVVGARALRAGRPVPEGVGARVRRRMSAAMAQRGARVAKSSPRGSARGLARGSSGESARGSARGSSRASARDTRRSSGAARPGTRRPDASRPVRRNAPPGSLPPPDGRPGRP